MDTDELLTEDNMSGKNVERFWGQMNPQAFAWYLRGNGNCLTPSELIKFRKNVIRFRRAWLRKNGKELEEFFEDGNIPSDEFFTKAFKA